MHISSGFVYFIVRSDINLAVNLVIYRGLDVVQEFSRRMNAESENINKILKSKVIVISITVKGAFQLVDNFYLCDLLIDADRVSDHDHFASRYKGVAHSKCNLKLQFPADKRNVKITILIFTIFEATRF